MFKDGFSGEKCENAPGGSAYSPFANCVVCDEINAADCISMFQFFSMQFHAQDVGDKGAFYF